MLDPLQSAALSRTPAPLAERCWNPPNQWSLTWRQRPKPPTHYTYPSISQPTSETAGVPAAGCHYSLVGIGVFFSWALAFPPRGPCVWLPSLVAMVHHDGHPFILLTLLSYCPTPSILPLPPYHTPTRYTNVFKKKGLCTCNSPLF